MRIAVDRKNNRVIAMGTYKGKKVKAIAVCHPGDSFDEQKGREIATLKYRLKEKEVRLDYHKANIKALNEHKNWVNRVLDDEMEIVSNMSRDVECLKVSTINRINEIVK